MKTVILLAGKGRRISNQIAYEHKSLINLNGKPLLYYLIQNIMKTNINEIVPILGYNGKDVLDQINKWCSNTNIIPIWNDNYENTNNLYSLYCARELLQNEEFISINGDMVFDYKILEDIKNRNGSQIAIDDIRCKEKIDSPGVCAFNGKISDLGRHISSDNRIGYAIGIYKYSKKLSNDFFALSEVMLEKDINYGFHDPLRQLFGTHEVGVASTKRKLWMDIDEFEDIAKAEKYIKLLADQ